MENQTQTGPVGEDKAATSVQPELSVNDLLQVRAVVELAVRRGSFQANELTAVGAIYDRLNTFLNAVAPPAPQTAENSANEQPAA